MKNKDENPNKDAKSFDKKEENLKLFKEKLDKYMKRFKVEAAQPEILNFPPKAGVSADDQGCLVEEIPLIKFIDFLDDVIEGLKDGRSFDENDDQVIEFKPKETKSRGYFRLYMPPGVKDIMISPEEMEDIVIEIREVDETPQKIEIPNNLFKIAQRLADETNDSVNQVIETALMDSFLGLEEPGEIADKSHHKVDWSPEDKKIIITLPPGPAE